MSYSSSSGNYLGSSGGYLGSSGDYLGSSGDYLGSSGDYPGSSSDYLGSSGDYPDSYSSYYGIVVTGVMFQYRSSLAYCILAAVALLGALIQAYRVRPRWLNPYATSFTASLCYLISGALFSSLGTAKFSTAQAATAHLTSMIFFANVFAPIAWLTVFITFHLTVFNGAWKLDKFMTAVYFGYLWAAIIIVAEIGIAGSLNQLGTVGVSYSTMWTILGALQFTSHGLWVFLLPFAVQTYLSWKDIHHFWKTFLPYVGLLFFVNVGRSVQSNINTMDGVIATFVLARLFGIFAIYLAIIFGHQWQPNTDAAPSNPSDSPSAPELAETGQSKVQTSA
ncbi:hypothetical protein EC973_007796 [Apophysomyces ossiformis]|uniref:Uncharacterized protein n=1 Tax=Apophysomyces ossiformis TaxID=679940 RepID=A0A8H7BPA5_9FUNG|nr:hypothetical protein EC973_007796 [Apophysomyces ossiformis]